MRREYYDIQEKCLEEKEEREGGEKGRKEEEMVARAGDDSGWWWWKQQRRQVEAVQMVDAGVTLLGAECGDARGGGDDGCGGDGWNGGWVR